jgi:hypothetical protein
MAHLLRRDVQPKRSPPPTVRFALAVDCPIYRLAIDKENTTIRPRRVVSHLSANEASSAGQAIGDAFDRAERRSGDTEGAGHEPG